MILTLSVKRPVWLLLVILPLLVVSGIGITRIGFDDGLRSVFASDSQTFQDYVTSSEQFAHSETDVAILVAAPDGLSSKNISTLQDFVLNAQFLDGVDAVFSVFSLRKRDPLSGEMVSFLPPDLTDAKAVDEALDTVNAQPATGARLISADKRQTVVVLSLAQSIADMHGSSKVLRELRALADATQAESGLKIGMTGLLSVRDQIIYGLKTDQIRINILGAIAGFLVSLVLFRSFWVTLLNTLVPVAALVFCLGAFGWFGMSINALTNALPVLILVLASSDSIHMTYEIRRQMADGATLVRAVITSVMDIAAPCALTSLTTILAFASLSISDSPVVRDMALAGAVGVFIAMLTVLFVHPLVFVVAGRVPAIARALPQRERRRPMMGAAAFDAVIRRPISVSLAGLVLLLLALAVFFPIKTSYRFMENIDPTQPVAQVMAQIEDVAGPITSIDIPIKLPAGVEPWQPDVLAELADLDQRLGTVPGVRAVISLNALVGQLSANSTHSIAQRLQDILTQLPGRFRNRMVSEDGRSLQIMLLVRDEGSQAVLAQVEKIKAVIADKPMHILKPGRPTGFLVMSSTLATAMIRQLTYSFLIAALICPALIGLWFRRLDFGLAATIPNILPIVLVGAALTVSGIGIQFTSALALTIAFGIALDDSIHVFNRLAIQDRANRQLITQDAIFQAIRHVTPVLITTTVVLSAGILATQVSDMPMIRFFGLLCIGTFLLALLCDLLLLPALVSWFSLRKEKDRVRQ